VNPAQIVPCRGINPRTYQLGVIDEYIHICTSRVYQSKINEASLSIFLLMPE
jgi:hypothetical protein